MIYLNYVLEYFMWEWEGYFVVTLTVYLAYYASFTRQRICDKVWTMSYVSLIRVFSTWKLYFRWWRTAGCVSLIIPICCFRKRMESFTRWQAMLAVTILCCWKNLQKRATHNRNIYELYIKQRCIIRNQVFTCTVQQSAMHKMW